MLTEESVIEQAELCASNPAHASHVHAWLTKVAGAQTAMARFTFEHLRWQRFVSVAKSFDDENPTNSRGNVPSHRQERQT